MQRNAKINIKDKQAGLQFQNATENALEELNQIIDQKSVTNYIPKNPVENLIRIDETNNILYVFNTTTKEWVAYTPA